MTERIDQPEAAAPSKRGEAAWKAEKEAIAARNEKARKAGRELRHAQDEQRAQRRRVEELRERAAMDKILTRRA
jgi:hypothetical protein